MYTAQCRVRLLLACVQYSAQCSVRLFLVCVQYRAHCSVRLLLVFLQCTMKRETVFGVCTVHSEERDCYWCVYSARCSVRLLLVCVHYRAHIRVRLWLVCVQCTVKRETVFGVCTVHSEKRDCYWCVYSAQEWEFNLCVYSAEWDWYCCVYSVQCRVRLTLHFALYTHHYAATRPKWSIAAFFN